MSPWKDKLVSDACRRVWDGWLGGSGQVDPDVVAREMSFVDGADSERLRWFAIWLEENVMPDWPVLQGVYAVADRASPNDPRVLHSFAVAALGYVDLVSEGQRPTLLAEAVGRAEDAVRVAPDDPDARFLLGLARYADETMPVIRAESEFRMAVDARPDFARARLYLAHALVDLERWDEALLQLQGLEEDELLRQCGVEQAWRIGKRRELLAVCLLRLGRPEEASTAVESFLEFARQAESGDVDPPARLASLSPQLPGPLAAKIEAVLRQAREASGTTWTSREG